MAPEDDDIVAVSKSDLSEGDFSAKTGDGLDRLMADVSSVLAKRAGSVGIATRERHRVAMEKAITSLGIARDQLETGTGLTELIAEELRGAIRALDSLVGYVDVEHLLDEIFSSFCIGK